MTVLHISRSRKDLEKRSVMYCPTCECRRRFYSWFQEWYGWHSTCCACGEQWADGEMLPRPFCPGWRKKNSDRAKHGWNDVLAGMERR